jgi:hypothetical protein
MYGLPNQLVVAESPDVLEGIISDAVASGDRLFISLHSQGSYLDMSGIPASELRRMEPEQIVARAERRDSFTDLRIRHELVVAFREAHPGEVVE